MSFLWFMAKHYVYILHVIMIFVAAKITSESPFLNESQMALSLARAHIYSKFNGENTLFCTCANTNKFDDDFFLSHTRFYACTTFEWITNRRNKRRKDVIKIFFLSLSLEMSSRWCEMLAGATALSKKMFISDSHHVNIADACIKCYLYLSASHST